MKNEILSDGQILNEIYNRIYSLEETPLLDPTAPVALLDVEASFYSITTNSNQEFPKVDPDSEPE